MNLLIAVAAAGIMRLAYESGAPFFFGTSAGNLLWSILSGNRFHQSRFNVFQPELRPPLDGFGIITSSDFSDWTENRGMVVSISWDLCS